MHQARGSHHFSAKNFSNRLMSKADAQGRHVRAEPADGFTTDACLPGVTRAWRDAESLGRERGDLVQCDLIVAENPHLRPQFAKILDEIVRK